VCDRAGSAACPACNYFSNYEVWIGHHPMSQDMIQRSARSGSASFDCLSSLESTRRFSQIESLCCSVSDEDGGSTRC
jgi:hypothetical protein